MVSLTGGFLLIVGENKGRDGKRKSCVYVDLRTRVIHRWIERLVRNQCMKLCLGGNAYGYCFESSSALSSSVRSRP
jgi:hypothetical protein